VWLFGAALVVVGVSALTLTNTTNSLMQLTTDPAMRGRVLAIRLAIALGGTPIGAPVVGWVADRFGPRWSLVLAAAAALVGALVAVRYLVVHRGLRVRLDAGRLRLQLNESSPVR
jgi:MFS family permease